MTDTIPSYSYRLADVVECTGHPIDVLYGLHRGHVDEAPIFGLTGKEGPKINREDGLQYRDPLILIATAYWWKSVPVQQSPVEFPLEPWVAVRTFDALAVARAGLVLTQHSTVRHHGK